LTSILDGIHRRHIDLYPIFSHFDQLVELPPPNQIEFTLDEIIAKQDFIRSSAEMAIWFFQQEERFVPIPISGAIHNISTPHKTIDEVLDFITSNLHKCTPSQFLVGNILINIPVKNNVEEAHTHLSLSLRSNKLSQEQWRESTLKVSTQNQTISTWLKEVIQNISKFYPNPIVIENVSNEILDLKPKFQISGRLHPDPSKLSGRFSYKHEVKCSEKTTQPPVTEDPHAFVEIPVPHKQPTKKKESSDQVYVSSSGVKFNNPQSIITKSTERPKGLESSDEFFKMPPKSYIPKPTEKTDIKSSYGLQRFPNKMNTKSSDDNLEKPPKIQVTKPSDGITPKSPKEIGTVIHQSSNLNTKSVGAENVYQVKQIVINIPFNSNDQISFPGSSNVRPRMFLNDQQEKLTDSNKEEKSSEFENIRDDSQYYYFSDYSDFSEDFYAEDPSPVEVTTAPNLVQNARRSGPQFVEEFFDKDKLKYSIWTKPTEITGGFEISKIENEAPNNGKRTVTTEEPQPATPNYTPDLQELNTSNIGTEPNQIMKAEDNYFTTSNTDNVTIPNGVTRAVEKTTENNLAGTQNSLTPNYTSNDGSLDNVHEQNSISLNIETKTQITKAEDNATKTQAEDKTARAIEKTTEANLAATQIFPTPNSSTGELLESDNTASLSTEPNQITKAKDFINDDNATTTQSEDETTRATEETTEINTTPQESEENPDEDVEMDDSLEKAFSDVLRISKRVSKHLRKYDHPKTKRSRMMFSYAYV